MTEPELKLWSRLKGKPWGFKFRRQHPLSVYIVDFYCHAAKLVIEVDGLIHLDKVVRENDEQKSYDIRNMGLSILRFSNNDVLLDIEGVMNTIHQFISSIEPVNHPAL